MEPMQPAGGRSARGAESDLAMALLQEADPCLSDDDRAAVRMALGSAEPYLAILVVVRRVSRQRFPLSRAVLRAFRGWLRTLPALSETGHGWPPMQLDLHVFAADIQAWD